MSGTVCLLHRYLNYCRWDCVLLFLALLCVFLTQPISDPAHPLLPGASRCLRVTVFFLDQTLAFCSSFSVCTSHESEESTQGRVKEEVQIMNVAPPAGTPLREKKAAGGKRKRSFAQICAAACAFVLSSDYISVLSALVCPLLMIHGCVCLEAKWQQICSNQVCRSVCSVV